MDKNSSKIKLSTLQKILIFGSAGMILLGAILILILSLSLRRPHIAFYNVSPKVQDTVLKMMNTEQKAKKEKNFEALILDSSIPLSAQEKILKKADFLIASNDYDVKSFISSYKKIKPLSKNLMDGFPSATVETIPVSQDSIKYTPILFDFYEIDINYPAFIEHDFQNLALWSDLINFALSTRDDIPSPFLITGADDAFVIDVFGMFLETLYGYEELQKLEEALYSAFKKDLAANSANNDILQRKLSELTSGDTALNNTMLSIIKMINADILPKNYRDYVAKDFEFFMDGNLCAAAFTKLSRHRELKYSTLKNYKSIYSPSVYPTQERKFQAPQIIAASLNKKMTDYVKLLCETNQSELCNTTGLAPVQKNCSVPDLQADDVRYWLAASSGPIMPLSASVPSEKARKFLAQYLRDNSSF